MPGAKLGLADYVSRNPFAKAKKVSSYDEHFVIATISKNPDSFNYLIQNKTHTVQKLNGILKLHSPSYSSNRLIAPQLPTLIHKNSQLRIKPVALQPPHHKTSLPIASQFAPQKNS